MPTARMAVKMVLPLMLTKQTTQTFPWLFYPVVISVGIKFWVFKL